MAVTLAATYLARMSLIDPGAIIVSLHRDQLAYRKGTRSKVSGMRGYRAAKVIGHTPGINAAI